MKPKKQVRMIEYTLQYSSKREYLLYRLVLDSLEDTPSRKGIVVTYPTRMPNNAEDGGCIRVDIPDEHLEFIKRLHDFMRTTWRDRDKDFPTVMRMTKQWIKEYD